MSEENPVDTIGTLDRKQVGNLLRQAFHHVSTYDYGFKYVDNEEDIRAAFYYRIRQLLDFEPHWRVFLSFPLIAGDEYHKPDLCFLLSKSLSFKKEEITIEILVELKNWPSRKEIIADLKKLSLYSQLCAERSQPQPELYFVAILGHNMHRHFPQEQKQEEQLIEWTTEWIKCEANKLSIAGINILLRYHDFIYRGPWHKVYGDPWRAIARGK